MTRVHRVRQGLLAFGSRPDADEATIIESWLTPPQQDAFRALPAHDRAHLIRVGKTMIAQVPDHSDLIVAALLHDLGKSDGHHHVRLLDRVVKVLLQTREPRVLRKLAAPPPTRLRGGLVLAVHHDIFGAAQAKLLGCNERICWLIARHERSTHFNDPELCLLATIDNATP